MLFKCFSVPKVYAAGMDFGLVSGSRRLVRGRTSVASMARRMRLLTYPCLHARCTLRDQRPKRFGVGDVGYVGAGQVEGDRASLIVAQGTGVSNRVGFWTVAIRSTPALVREPEAISRPSRRGVPGNSVLFGKPVRTNRSHHGGIFTRRQAASRIVKKSPGPKEPGDFFLVSSRTVRQRRLPAGILRPSP